MASALLIRLRPLTPFRFGPSSGARDQTDLTLHSDSLYGAVSSAMGQLGRLYEWLAATARAPEPAVRFTSLFPFSGTRLYITPPRTVWPAAAGKLRSKSARFIPLDAVRTLLSGGSLSEDRWLIDPSSACLLPIERNLPAPPPFRVSHRRAAAVDRQVEGNVELHSTACLEFAPGAGLWCAAVFAGASAVEQWSDPVVAAFRLLGDSGIGGERSRGWGRFEIRQEPWDPARLAPAGNGQPLNAWWTLSLFSPGIADQVDWERGNYSLVSRTGRVDATGSLKRAARMVEEGSVLVAPAPPIGSAHDVAPEDSSHPVFRAGFAVTVPVSYTPPRAHVFPSPEPEPVREVTASPVPVPEAETALPGIEPAPVVEPVPESQPEPATTAEADVVEPPTAPDEAAPPSVARAAEPEPVEPPPALEPEAPASEVSATEPERAAGADPAPAQESEPAAGSAPAADDWTFEEPPPEKPEGGKPE